MSMGAIERFYEKLKEDKALQEGVKTIQEQADFIAFAQGWGFEFTAGELDTFLAEEAKKPVLLSDEELRNAAGGLHNEDGYLITTEFYCCSHWVLEFPARACEGRCCRTCKHWRFGSPFFAGTCKCEANRTQW